MKKQLYRSSNKMIAGVCAGLAEYLNIDTTFVRLAWALLSLLSAAFPGFLIYIVCAIVIPSKDKLEAEPTEEEVYGMKSAKIEE